MVFRNWDSNAGKVNLYESVRKGLGEIYEDEPKAVTPASVRENQFKDLDGVNEIDLTKYQAKVNTEKEQIKKRISSRPAESKEFDAKVCHLLYILTRLERFSTWVENFHIIAIFLNSVYRVEISTRDENIHIIIPLMSQRLEDSKKPIKRYIFDYFL